MVGGKSDSENVQKPSKTFMKGGDDNGVNYVYLLNWNNPKFEKQKSNIMIIAEIFIGILFVETGETNDGTWLYFRDPLKLEQVFYIKEIHFSQIQ